MKKAFLPILFIIAVSTARAQVAASAISENFDVACATATGFPAGWFVFNPLIGTYPDGAWRCGPGSGDNTSPGIVCTGFFDGSFHLDTSYLITPKMNISANTDSDIYLRFDTRTTSVHLGARLGFFIGKARDTDILHPLVLNYTDITTGISPIMADADSANWVTHQVNISSYKAAGDFYLSFRYTSTDSSGNVWYLDNVITSSHSIYESVPVTDKKLLPLTIIGNSSPSKIVVACDVQTNGMFKLAVYDMMGRVVYREDRFLAFGKNTLTISDINLPQGMYLVKLANEKTYGTVKTMVD